MVTKSQAEEIVKKYQSILHLEDWQIKINVVSQKIIQKIGRWNSKIVFGCNVIRYEEKLANIYIWNKADKNAANLTVEAIVVHEMVHLKTYLLTTSFDMISDEISNKQVKNIFNQLNDRELESVINWFTRIILDFTGDSYINQQSIDYELEKIQKSIKKRK